MRNPSKMEESSGNPPKKKTLESYYSQMSPVR